jgi:hypothetical protein
VAVISNQNGTVTQRMTGQIERGGCATAALRASGGSADTVASCSGGVAAFMAMVFGCALMETGWETPSFSHEWGPRRR